MSAIPKYKPQQNIVSKFEKQIDMNKVFNQGDVIFRSEYPMIDWVVFFANQSRAKL